MRLLIKCAELAMDCAARAAPYFNPRLHSIAPAPDPQALPRSLEIEFVDPGPPLLEDHSNQTKTEGYT
jgi:hypothetical protein